MINIKIFILTLQLLNLTQTFYISKIYNSTLFLNQVTTFNISHNGGDIIQFNAPNCPQFITVLKNGTITILPKNQGIIKLPINALNIPTNTVLTTFSYYFIVLDKKKEFQKPLWVIDQQNYYERTTERPLIVETEGFDYHAPIYTNQNIRLNLKCKNAIGNIKWIFEGLPQTFKGNQNSGLIIGYVQSPGNLVIRCIVVDSLYRTGQIYLFLKFNQYAPGVNLSGQTTYIQYDYRKIAQKKQKLQNAGLLQKQLKYLLNNKNVLNSLRLQKLNNFRNISLFKQQLILDEQVLSQQILSKTSQSDSQLTELTKFQNQLKTQKQYVQKLRKMLSDKQKDYSIKLQQNQNSQSIRNLLRNQSQTIKKDFDSVKRQISDLQTEIYNVQMNLKNTQFQRERQNISFIAMQKQQVRTRSILQIRKNIQLQYLIKKAQTDNKVLRYQDYAFLAQSNYDAAYSRYKSTATQYVQLSIKSKYLQAAIQQVIAQYNAMSQRINQLKINYSISLGKFQTLTTAKQQMNKLSNYVLKSFLNTSSNTNLSRTQIIDKEAVKQVEQYPFTGCKRIGNYGWAGSGKIKIIGSNSLSLTSQQILNYGRCTKLNSALSKQLKLDANQWIQYTGYYWDGAIQVDSITIISEK